LVRLVYHAQGAVSAVSLLMHLSAAVEVRPGGLKNRPCVVVAGGREPPHYAQRTSSTTSFPTCRSASGS